MANFTMTLGEVLTHIPTVWDKTDPYPIFDEAYREELNRKIVDHYLLYEIGQETIGQFVFALNRKMREIMPMHNQMYKSQIDIDPLQTINVHTSSENDNTIDSSAQTESSDTETQTGTSSSTQNSNGESASRSVSSELPQVRLSGDEDYATEAADTNSQTTGSGSASGTTTGKNASNGTVSTTGANRANGTMSTTTAGTQGHGAKLLREYRKSFLNIDLDVIKELETLFFAVWDNGDDYADNDYFGGMRYGRISGRFGII